MLTKDTHSHMPFTQACTRIFICLYVSSLHGLLNTQIQPLSILSLSLSNILSHVQGKGLWKKVSEMSSGKVMVFGGMAASVAL